MHDPAEDDIVELTALEEVVKHVTDVIFNHGLSLLSDGEGRHVPAPVTIQENTVR